MNFAYVTFLIKDDSYVPGALVFAYSLKKQNVKADLLCFVNNEISKNAIESLKIIYDKIIHIDKIMASARPNQSEKELSRLFSRCKALLLEDPRIAGKKYDKIVVSDSDVIAINKWDTLFDLTAPAGIINESKAHTMQYGHGEFILTRRYYKTAEWMWHKIYKDFPHGTKLPKEMTDRVNSDNGNMGVNSAIYLLEPKIATYKDILKDLKNKEVKEKISNYNWPEIQYLTQKLSGNWHNIDLNFASISSNSLKKINGIHFLGLKPWDFNNKSLTAFACYDDFKLWYEIYNHMIINYPKLLNNYKLRNLQTKIILLQRDKQYRFKKFKVSNISHLLK